MPSYTREELIAAARAAVPTGPRTQYIDERSTIYSLNGWLIDWDAAHGIARSPAAKTKREAWKEIGKRLEDAGRLRRTSSAKSKKLTLGRLV